MAVEDRTKADTGPGGNITSDNISPRHLLNIKRLAYEVTPVAGTHSSAVNASTGQAQGDRLPRAPAAPAPPQGIAAGPLARRIDQFLASRGYVVPEAAESRPAVAKSEPAAATQPPQLSKPLDFVCEDDVRQAIRQGRKLVIGERTIVTPAARDLADEHRLFVDAEWPR